MGAHEAQNRFDVFICFIGAGVSAVFAVIGQVTAKAQIHDGVRIDDAGSPTRNEGPHPGLGAEHGQLQGCTALLVQILDIGFLRGQSDFTLVLLSLLRVRLFLLAGIL